MPNRWHDTPAIVDVLRARARELGLWNMASSFNMAPEYFARKHGLTEARSFFL